MKDTSVGAIRDWNSITSSGDGTKLAATVNSGHIWKSTNWGAMQMWRDIAISNDATRPHSGGRL